MKFGSKWKKTRMNISVLYLTVGLVFALITGVNLYTYYVIRAIGHDYDSMNVLSKQLRQDLQAAESNLNDIIDPSKQKTVEPNKQKNLETVVYSYFNSAIKKSTELSRLQKKINLTADIASLKRQVTAICSEGKQEEKNKAMEKFSRENQKVIGILDRSEDERSAMLDVEINFVSFIFIVTLIGNLLAFGGIFYVISANNRQVKAKEKKMNTVNANFYAIMQGLDSVLLTFDTNGTILNWNENAVRYFGFKSSEAIGKNLYTLVPAFQQFKSFFDKVLYSQKRHYNYHEQMHINKGPTRIVDMLCVPLILGAGKGEKGERALLVKMDDVTSFSMEQEHAVQVRGSQLVGAGMENVIKESSALHAQAGSILEALNTFASEHQLEMELTPYAAFLNNTLAELSMIPQKYAATLQSGKLNSVPMDLNELIMYTLRICLKTFDPCINVEVSQNESKSWIMADAAALSRALFCLMNNAAEALTEMRPEDEPQGGIISVSVEKIAGETIVSDRIMRFRQAVQEPAYWVVMISDTGVGIPSEVRSSIYDLFFTTKNPEHHKGLGLAVAANIVNELGGYIDVNSKVGNGSVFKIYLPELPGMTNDSQSGTQLDLTSSDDDIVLGQGNIMLVSDDIFMYQITSRLIEKFGYQVTSFDNGFAALDTYAQDLNTGARTIQAVICNLTSGVMRNSDMITHLREMDPQVKVAVLIDSDQSEEAEQLRDLGVNDFITMPYSLPDFSKILANFTAPQDDLI